jgi:[amino group carrier protein]-lysine/ornithine hydrolase
MDDEEATRLLVGAVERPSPSGEEGEVARFLVAAMRPFAPNAALDAVGNVVATVGEGRRRVVLLGHIDTVGGQPPVRLDRGVLRGRGAVDAKGPFCAMVAAASRLPAAARAALTVELVGAVEEEAPSSRGARHRLVASPRPDLVVIGEPSGWDAVTIGYKGRLDAVVEARRPAGHSARAEASASEAVVEAWQALRAWAEARSGAASGAFAAVGATLLALGSGGDGLEDRARAHVALRLPPSCPPGEAGDAVRQAVAAAAEASGVALSLSVGTGESAYRGPRDTPLTRAFRTAIRRHGGTPRLTLKTGTSDMNVVAPHWPVPMLAYGPGDAALDHAPDEHLRVDEYLRSIRVLVTALEALAHAGSRPRGRSLDAPPGYAA